jgi:hypothetical protein
MKQAIIKSKLYFGGINKLLFNKKSFYKTIKNLEITPEILFPGFIFISNLILELDD